MKAIVLSLLILFVVACKVEPKEKKTNENEIPFEGLIGNWERTNDEGDKKTFEMWEKVNTRLYKGLAYTMQGSDTVFKEELKLLQKDNQWIYEVSGVHDDPVAFSIQEYDSKSFSCVNELNEFPKMIAYSIKGEKLKALISAGKDEILFDFIKTN